jgi:hypothetical protein
MFVVLTFSRADDIFCAAPLVPHTMNTSTLVPTGLTLESISPKLGARFSPNLHAFLKNKRNQSILRFGRVYKDADGVLWLGYPDAEFFIGDRLISVLCNGARASTAAHVRVVKGLVEVEGFWNDYRHYGRCAVDPEHKMHFVGDDTRWSVKGDQRECLWCGKATQNMRRWTETVERSEWV